MVNKYYDLATSFYEYGESETAEGGQQDDRLVPVTAEGRASSVAVPKASVPPC